MIAETAYTFDDLLLRPKFSAINSRKRSTGEVDTFSWVGGELLRLPVFSSNMDQISGTDLKMSRQMAASGGMAMIHRAYSDPASTVQKMWDSWQADMPADAKICLSVGSIRLATEQARLDAILSIVPKDRLVLCAEIAHGHSLHMKETIAAIRARGFKGTLIAGNICTAQAADDLRAWGADVGRVGVGPGGNCSTRIQTGCGYPQLSAIYECAKAGFPIIADGGIRTAGDVCKALAAGAVAVMIGGMLKGSDCVPGWDEEMASAKEAWADGNKYDPTVQISGMASNVAKNAQGIPSGFEEGVVKTVPCLPEGSTKNILSNIEDGLRSSMSYLGAGNLATFRKNASWVRVTEAGRIEGTPHVLSQ